MGLFLTLMRIIGILVLAVILLVQIAVVLCTSGYMKRMGGGQ